MPARKGPAMTVQTNTNVASFTGNGATTYPIGFKFNSAADLIVERTVIATGVTTTLTLNSDYTVDDAGDEEGGSVTFSVAPTDADSVKVTRVVDLLQLTDLRNQGKFYAETHENVFDLLVMIDQQQQTEINTANDNADLAVETASAANLKSDQAVAKADQNLVDMRAQYDAFEQGAALYVIGDYSPGLVISAYNQIFRKDGEFYRAAASLGLPYTLTGNWATESSNFVSVGDDVLRQELASSTGAGLVGYKGRGLLSRLSEVVYFADFGAVGDGVADDSDAIEAAMNSGARRVIATPGAQYRITKQIVLYTSGVELDLAGASLIQTSTNIYGIHIGRDLSGEYVQVEDVYIHHGKFYGADNGQGAEYSVALAINTPPAGPFLKNGGCNRIRIEHNLFSGWSMSTAANATTDLHWHFNVSRDTFYHDQLTAAGYGLLLQTCFDTYITNNHFLSVAKSDPATTTDRHAIYVSAHPAQPLGADNVCKGVYIGGNTVDWRNIHPVSGFEACMVVRGAFDVRIVGNSFLGGFGGISYAVDNGPGEGVVISNNSFRGTLTNGTNSQGCISVIRASGSFIAKRFAITGNVCEIIGSTGFGITLSAITGATISGNTITAGAAIAYGIQLAGNCSDILIAPNTLALHEAYALAFSGADNSKILIHKQHISFTSATGNRSKVRFFTLPAEVKFAYPRTFVVTSNGSGTVSVANGEDYSFVVSAASEAFGVTVTFDGSVDVSMVGITALSGTSSIGSIYKRGVGTDTIVFGVLDHAGNVLPAGTNAYSIQVSLPC
jgi:hypothetical protein